jgi:hypothetical protein
VRASFETVPTTSANGVLKKSLKLPGNARVLRSAACLYAASVRRSSPPAGIFISRSTPFQLTLTGLAASTSCPGEIATSTTFCVSRRITLRSTTSASTSMNSSGRARCSTRTQYAPAWRSSSERTRTWRGYASRLWSRKNSTLMSELPEDSASCTLPGYS